MKRLIAILVIVSILALLLNGCERFRRISFVPENEIKTSEVEQILGEIEEIEKNESEAINTEDIEFKIEVTEGDLVKLNLQSEDPDNDKLLYTFTSPLNANGEWQTKKGDAGEYVATVTASDGELETKQPVLIIVNILNNPPVLENIADITVNEGSTVSFSPVATDPDNEKVTLAYSGWMSSDSYTTDYDDAGEHLVTITASDGELEAKQTVKVTVKNVNREPILAGIDDMEVMEGDLVEIKASALDPDNDQVSITYPEPLDSSGSWQTEEGDEGVYELAITASDGELGDSRKVKITVVSPNHAPEISIDTSIEVTEGDEITLSPEVTDEDGDEVTVTYSGWMNSNSYTTTYDDAGEYTVTVKASDGKKEASVDVNIIVNNKNRPPRIIGISQG